MKFKKENWPYLKFTEDDKLVFRAIKPNKVEILSVENKFSLIDSIDTPNNFDFFAISPKKENLMIAFITCEVKF